MTTMSRPLPIHPPGSYLNLLKDYLIFSWSILLYSRQMDRPTQFYPCISHSVTTRIESRQSSRRTAAIVKLLSQSRMIRWRQKSLHLILLSPLVRTVLSIRQLLTGETLRRSTQQTRSRIRSPSSFHLFWNPTSAQPCWSMVGTITYRSSFLGMMHCVSWPLLSRRKRTIHLIASPPMKTSMILAPRWVVDFIIMQTIMILNQLTHRHHHHHHLHHRIFVEQQTLPLVFIHLKQRQQHQQQTIWHFQW